MINFHDSLQEIDKLANQFERFNKSIQNMNNFLATEYKQNIINIMNDNVSRLVIMPDVGTSQGSLMSGNRVDVVKQTSKRIVLLAYNDDQHATYVEFGTGRVGEESPHPEPNAFQFNGLEGRSSWEYYVMPGKKKTINGIEGWNYKGFRAGIRSQPFIYQSMRDVEKRFSDDIGKYLNREIVAK